jgi:hypothetical protein
MNPHPQVVTLQVVSSIIQPSVVLFSTVSVLHSHVLDPFIMNPASVLHKSQVETSEHSKQLSIQSAQVDPVQKVPSGQ